MAGYVTVFKAKACAKESVPTYIHHNYLPYLLLPTIFAIK